MKTLNQNYINRNDFHAKSKTHRNATHTFICVKWHCACSNVVNTFIDVFQTRHRDDVGDERRYTVHSIWIHKTRRNTQVWLVNWQNCSMNEWMRKNDAVTENGKRANEDKSTTTNVNRLLVDISSLWIHICVCLVACLWWLCSFSHCMCRTVT